MLSIAQGGGLDGPLRKLRPRPVRPHAVARGFLLAGEQIEFALQRANVARRQSGLRPIGEIA